MGYGLWVMGYGFGLQHNFDPRWQKWIPFLLFFSLFSRIDKRELLFDFGATQIQMVVCHKRRSNSFDGWTPQKKPTMAQAEILYYFIQFVFRVLCEARDTAKQLKELTEPRHWYQVDASVPSKWFSIRFRFTFFPRKETFFSSSFSFLRRERVTHFKAEIACTVHWILRGWYTKCSQITFTITKYTIRKKNMEKQELWWFDGIPYYFHKRYVALLSAPICYD